MGFKKIDELDSDDHILWLLGGILALVSLFTLAIVSGNENYAKWKSQLWKNYHVFHNSGINGRIQYSSHHNPKNASFEVFDDTNYYDVPITQVREGWGDRIKIFSEFAQRGDSVFKDKNSDTMCLIKNGEQYYYRTSKPSP